MEEKVIELVNAAFADVPCPTGDIPDFDVFSDGNIILLGADEFQFYFPRFVERSLAEGDRVLLDTLIFVLRGVDQGHSDYLVSLFDKSQQAAVRVLLYFLRDHPEYFADCSDSETLVRRAIPLWEKMM